MPRINRVKAIAFAVLSALLVGPLAIAQNNNPLTDPALDKPAPTLAEIVNHLEQKNRERLEALRGFQGTRSYRIEYHGPFGDREAEMTVDVRYQSPDNKEFTIVSESGSKFLFDHVLKGLLDGEKEAATPGNQERTALSTRNYSFALAALENTPDGKQYVLNVSPKTDYKYLYRGKIWVDAKDFAVTRIQAEPSKSPSFWVKKSQINHRYKKVGDFWLPVENRTQSWIRLGGQATLSIDYTDYKITGELPHHD